MHSPCTRSSFAPTFPFLLSLLSLGSGAHRQAGWHLPFGCSHHCSHRPAALHPRVVLSRRAPPRFVPAGAQEQIVTVGIGCRLMRWVWFVCWCMCCLYAACRLLGFVACSFAPFPAICAGAARANISCMEGWLAAAGLAAPCAGSAMPTWAPTGWECVCAFQSCECFFRELKFHVWGVKFLCFGGFGFFFS